MLILVVIIPLILLLVVIFSKVGGLTLVDPNSVFIPDGKMLYDMHIHTYRNRSLLRYKSETLVLNENEYFEIFSNYNDDEVQVIYATPHIDEHKQNKVQCGGVCNCFEEEMSHNRKSVSSLVYSHRYIALVTVFVLGFASARFVDDHIGDCYENAREILGYNEDSRNSFISCSMEEVACDTEEVEENERMEKEEHLLKYQCVGHCLDNPRSANWGGIDCTQESPGFRIMEVWESDIEEIFKRELFGFGRYDRREDLLGKYIPALYVIQHMFGFCKSIGRDYLDEIEKKKEIIQLIQSSTPKMIANDICRGTSHTSPGQKHGLQGVNLMDFDHVHCTRVDI